MSQKLRFGTRQRINYRGHVVCRRTYLAYDHLIRLDNERARNDYLRKNKFEKAIKAIKEQRR